MKRVAALAAACGLLGGGLAQAPPLALERTIPLVGVQGRIDHMAADAEGKRLFVAELGNGSVEAIDTATGRSLGRISGLKEPQGVAYLAARNEIAVATGGDGMVRFYRADDLAPAGALEVGGDADNLRIEPAAGALVVGFGDGSLGVIDPATHRVLRKASLPGHPESFQIEGGRAFVNVPDANAIVSVDLSSGRELAKWKNTAGRFNFPMALTPEGLAVVYRFPARLALIERASGRATQVSDTCGDSDDIFLDAPRRRLYVVCGGGAVDVFDAARGGYAHSARVATRSGARTGLFVPSRDRLYVAARASSGHPAELMVLRPAP